MGIILHPRARASPLEIREFIADDSDDPADGFLDLIDQTFLPLTRQSGAESPPSTAAAH